VLRALGYEDAQVRALVSEGVVKAGAAA
jgi:hypothetical protein